MGGSLTFGIRRSDGTQWRRGVWTNSLFHYTANPLFIAEDPDCLRAFMDSYPEDDKSNKEFTKDGLVSTGKPWWGYYNHFAPHYYGLVVFDFKEKKILSMQGYTGMDSLCSAGIINDIPVQWGENKDDPELRDVLIKKWEAVKEDFRKASEDRRDPYWLSSLEIFIHYALQGRIYYDDFYTVEGKEVFGNLPAPNGFETEDEVYLWFLEEFLKPRYQDRDSFRNAVIFRIKFPSFEVIEFEENSQGATAFRDKLLELGFTFTEDDEREWKKFIDERLAIEEENREWKREQEAND